MAKWYTITPINTSYNSRNVRLTKPIDLGCNVYFTIVPNWLNKVKGLENLSWYQRQVIEDAQYILVSEYEADSLGDPDLAWKGNKPRGKQDAALENIQLTNLALWLIKPSWIAFDTVLHIEERDSEKILRRSFSTQSVRPHDKDKDNYLELADFEKAHKLNLDLHDLQRTGSLWVASTTLWTAIISQSWEIRFLFLWIALEALFGTDTEIAYRISQRISFFISLKREDAPDLYKKVKESYKWRCQVVHGMKLHKLEREKSSLILYNTESFVRIASTKILEDTKLINIFVNNENREDFLDKLIFS